MIRQSIDWTHLKNQEQSISINYIVTRYLKIRRHVLKNWNAELVCTCKKVNKAPGDHWCKDMIIGCHWTMNPRQPWLFWLFFGSSSGVSSMDGLLEVDDLKHKIYHVVVSTSRCDFARKWFWTLTSTHKHWSTYPIYVGGIFAISLKWCFWSRGAHIFVGFVTLFLFKSHWNPIKSP